MWIKSENLLVFDLQVIHGESNRMWPRTLIAQLVKKLPAVQENRVGFLGQKDPLEKG